MANKDKTHIVVFSGSPRSKDTCPGQDGKTLSLAKHAMKKLPKSVKVDFIDLSVKHDGKIVYPCKGCISTANGMHCHWPCSCYGPGSAAENLPDLIYDKNIYAKLEKADGFVVFCPINWYSVPTQVKAMFDRLVCCNQTLTKHQAYDVLKIGKDIKKTSAAEQSGEYSSLLKNHLEGKFAAFFIHGDDGASDYKNKPMPESWNQKLEKKVNDPMSAVLEIVAQCQYSGIFVPEDLVYATHINKGLDYSEANEVHKDNKDLFKQAEDIVLKLVKHIEKPKKKGSRSHMMLESLLKLANRLDAEGKHGLADEVDSIVRNIVKNNGGNDAISTYKNS